MRTTFITNNSSLQYINFLRKFLALHQIFRYSTKYYKQKWSAKLKLKKFNSSELMN